MGKTYLSADLHLGHINILQYCNRPFKDVEDMNRGIIERWNATVRPEDRVIVVGDVCMGKLDLTLPLISTLNGHKDLILGNHDRPFGDWYKGEKKLEWIRQYHRAGFENIDDSMEIVTDGGEVFISHLPYLDSALEHEAGRSRHESVKLRFPEDLGIPALVGHVHDSFKTRKTSRGTPMVNVGVDVWDFKPVLLDEALELLWSL